MNDAKAQGSVCASDLAVGGLQMTGTAYPNGGAHRNQWKEVDATR